ncbi:hypothetical protein [Treponema denticola]|uniref:hypothetical protein n=1 Tax=Treponema denticola TaxID=158 RepID=UPI0020A4E237|nr:hypothetical protein [Treponema denticola]UTC82711.1 hypothetical protein HGJ18_05635 [Treponema denticola]
MKDMKDIKDVKKWIKENPINIKDKEKKMYKEIFKLKKMLEDEKIPFEWEAPHFDGYHLLYPEKENFVCSVIEFDGSYGGHHDLLEIMGLMTDAEIVKEQDDVLGWLTAENVFNRIKKHWDMVQKEK